MSKPKLVLRIAWERELFRTPGVQGLVFREAEKIAATAIKDAPRQRAPKKGIAKQNWNRIKLHIHARVAKDFEGWYGLVVTEEDYKVRHAMLQERGFHDRKGGEHGGHEYLLKALLKAEIE
ncbi:hypothetical protein ACH427_03220 [Streptomyces sp. NPDC020379]|uniref:hypothetical protein n=1 Tax=Streptomyces sp. NPDC020379 TaxID=3365071 RepID=UPI00379BD249